MPGKPRGKTAAELPRKSKRNFTRVNYSEIDNPTVVVKEEDDEAVIPILQEKVTCSSKKKLQPKKKKNAAGKKSRDEMDDFEPLSEFENESDQEVYASEAISSDEMPIIRRSSLKAKSQAKLKGKAERGGENDKTAAKTKQKRGCKTSLVETSQEEETKQEEAGPLYSADLARSARSECQKCRNKISKGVLRVGVIVEGGMWGPLTRWQHLECTIFRSVKNCEAISGYTELEMEDRELIEQRVQQSASEIDYDYLPVNADELVREEWKEKREPPAEIVLPLLPYQKEGLGWMYHQEQTDFHGGILADEMGMGKTLQAISLIVANRPDREDLNGVWSSAEKAQEMIPNKEARGGTLVICPLIAVLQWQSEIAKFTKENTLKVKLYHGSKRSTLASDLLEADVIITTYSIVEAEYRKMTSPSKVPCPDCGKRLYPDKLVIHRRYFCGEDAQLTAAQAKTERKQGPSTNQKSIKNKRKQNKNKRGKKKFEEESEVEDEDTFMECETPKEKVGNKRKAKNGMKKFPEEQQPNKKLSPMGPARKRLKKINGNKVDANFDSMEDGKDAAMGAETEHKYKSILHGISWFRVVLDEAHAIKSRSSSTARAVFALTSLNKWCLSGTPLQNRVGELYSLIRFLRIDPWGYYFCRTKGCECKSLHYRFGPEWRSCEECGHSPIHHYSMFNKKIMNPISRAGYVGEGKRAMLTLKDRILDEVLLRRTKLSRAEDIVLPPRIVRVKQHRLDEREEDFYQALYTQSQAQFNTYISSGTVLHNYAHIFDILIRLRQAVDHPYLVIYSNTRNDGDEARNARALADAESRATEKVPDAEEQDCCVCHDAPERPVSSQCGHTFCFSCVESMMQSAMEGAESLCPNCEAPLTIDLQKASADEENEEVPDGFIRKAKGTKVSHKSILNKINLASFQTSTKMEALMQELYAMEKQDPAAKAIVFSQFVNMLDLLQYRIKLAGFIVVKLAGNMSIDQRDVVLKSFREDSSCKVLLISLKAGGVALNLTVANHIFLMDPWWNPAGEMQAIDRTHRIGQYKPIFATRFIIEDTIEERILRLQDKKKLVFDGTVGGDQAALARLTVDDLRFLFSN